MEEGGGKGGVGGVGPQLLLHQRKSQHQRGLSQGWLRERGKRVTYTWTFCPSCLHTFRPGCTGVPTTFPSAVQPWCWKSRELDKMERCMQERMWEAPRLSTSEC